MKFLIALIFISTQVAAATCTSYQSTRRAMESLEFTILPGKTYAHLTEKECDYSDPRMRNCFETTSAVYSMTVLPRPANQWKLNLISGDGPESLIWKEDQEWVPGCPECNHAPQGHFKKIGALKNGPSTLCKVDL